MKTQSTEWEKILAKYLFDMVQNWERSMTRLFIVTPFIHLYAEHIMRNAGLDELQAGIKIARRNTSNLRYADDNTLMVESEEELKSLLMRGEENEKASLKLSIKQTNNNKKLRAQHPVPSLHGK